MELTNERIASVQRTFREAFTFTIVMMAALGACRLTTAQNSYSWGPNPIDNVYHNILNWTPSGFANSTSGRATIDRANDIFGTYHSPKLFANATMGGLTILNGGSFDQNGFLLLVDPGPSLSGHTEIRFGGTLWVRSGNRFDSESLALAGDLRIRGGLVEIDTEAIINGNGELDGYGAFRMTGQSNLVNNGLVYSNGLNLTFKIQSDNSSQFDWDGTADGGRLTVLPNTTMRIEMPVTDPFSSHLQIYEDGVFYVDTGLVLDTGTIDLNGGRIEGGNISVTELDALITTTSSSRIDSNMTMNAGTLRVSNGFLQFTGDATLGPAAIVEIVGSSYVIIDTDFVNNGGIIYGNEINVRNGGTFNMTDGSLSLHLLEIDNGASFTMFGGSLDVDDGFLQFTGNATFGPGAEVSVSGNSYVVVDEMFDNNGAAIFGNEINVRDGGAFNMTDGLLALQLLDIDAGGSFAMPDGTLDLDTLEINAGGSFVMSDGAMFANIVVGDLELSGGQLLLNSSINGSLKLLAGLMQVNGATLVDGDFSLQQDATLRLEADGDDHTDLVEVYGDLSLSGALDLNFDLPVGCGSPLTLIEVNGTRTGEFQNYGEGQVVGNYNGFDWRISYTGGDGNDIVLTADTETNLDQTQFIFTNGTGSVETNSPGFGQSFTAGVSGLLSIVDIATNGGTDGGSLTIEVRAGGGIDGPLLGSQVFTFGPNEFDHDFGPGGLWRLPLDISGAGIFVEQGTQYTFLIAAGSGEVASRGFTMNFGDDAGDVYPGGSLKSEAYGDFGTPDLVFATFVEVCDPFVLGDVNGDGAVNLLDVGPFIELLASGDYLVEADVNKDGVVNLLDVDPFIQVLAGN